MPKNQRYIPGPRTTVEISNRTIQSRLLLRPCPKLNEIAIGALARAQQRYDVAVHCFVMLSNHYHLLATVDSVQQLSRFVGYFQSKLAKEVCRLRGWKHKVWAREYDLTVLYAEDDDEAIRLGLARLRYLIENGCKEGLVASPLEWPGASTVGALASGSRSVAGVWINRTRQWFANQTKEGADESLFRERQSLELSQLPSLRDLAWEDYTREIEAIVRDVERATRDRHAQQGTTPLGRRAVLAQEPLRQPVASKRSPSPRVHTVSRASSVAFRRAYASFVDACRAATDLFRETGGLSAFPEGSFVPCLPIAKVRRTRHRARDSCPTVSHRR